MNAATTTIDVRQEILDTAHHMMSVKGFTAVGLNELLNAASVPKGSFYHYFKSKDGFGEELLRRYFDDYLAGMDELFSGPDRTGTDQLMQYFQNWQGTQADHGSRRKCLVVKLAAEVSDLSEGMRNVLLAGTAEIMSRLAAAITKATEDGSLVVDEAPDRLAERLYQTWLGASLLEKITRDNAPLKAAMDTTRRALGQTSHA